jgi:hypothetical protein
MLLAAAGNPDAPMDAEHVRALIGTFVGWHFEHLVAHPHLRRILAWEAAEGWDTLIEAKRGGQLCPPWVKAIAEFFGRAQAAGLIRKEVDPYVAMAHVKSMVLIHLLSLPNYEAIFCGVDFSSPTALAHARDQLISFAVHALMEPATLALQPEGTS